MQTQLRASASELSGRRTTVYVFMIIGLTTFFMGLAIWPLKIEYTDRSSLEYNTPAAISLMGVTPDQTLSENEFPNTARMVGFVGRPMSKQHFWILVFCSITTGTVFAMVYRREPRRSVLSSAGEIQQKLGVPLIGVVPITAVAERSGVTANATRVGRFVFAGEVLLIFVFCSVVVMSAASHVFFSELIANPFAAFSYLVTTWLS